VEGSDEGSDRRQHEWAHQRQAARSSSSVTSTTRHAGGCCHHHRRASSSIAVRAMRRAFSRLRCGVYAEVARAEAREHF
jgi:hypothetical protein